MLPSLPIQRVKKRHKIALLLVRQLKRKDQRILVRILDAAFIIEIHDIFKLLEAALVHIRGASGDLPQGWGFKCAEFFGVTGPHVATKIHFVVIPADTDVVKLFIGEVESGMAFRASCLIPEQKEALLGRFWN